MTDSQIIQLIIEGKHEYYAELIQRHEQKVLIFIHYMLKNNAMEGLAEDLCQETFFKAYKSLYSFRDKEATFSTWLYTIARNTVLSELRKSKKNGQYLEDTNYEPKTELEEQPEYKLIKNERIQLVREAINTLPDNQRQALILREYEQLDYKQISEMMNCSISAVKSLIFRGRSAIKNRLEQYIRPSAE
ncbi:RNA polymerase subunit sigma-24 [Desulfuribacillus stibiiarsenatis]|uniref:RNA polymerase subunit sigma-24 n=1 Tax=Desulfuribacillus stibiiarsenatis TaxID=1390249 RepID=A0A1E5L714_9FIRM|nr:sigma-70 family RNA polymerase sigma factor [Desulfuribacillus stibiiarsenatis]OEH85935.1 RNA polymerase subunit sigma-24 [Desulfuribacillus stibiiarsenatis]